MFNKDLNRFSDGYRRQEEDEYDEADEDQQDTPQGNLNGTVHKIATTLGKAAFDSCKNHIEFDEDTLVTSIWEQVQGIVRKPWFKEALIISSVLIFKTGLFIMYRKAKQQGLEIVNL